MCHSQFRGSFICILFCLILILLASEKSISQTSELKNSSEEKKKNIDHDFYAGAKVGVVYLLGVELNYIMETHEVSRFYLALAVQTSLVVNSANAGGGIFLGKTGLGLGCRYHHLLWFDAEPESKIQPGYGPEIIYNKTIGTRYIINLHAGGIITKGSFFPDISFGIFLPLN